ncbi:hypothetical protein ACFOQM_14780 [Paenibacillus sp. GCM10012307]|uniref:Uncharacterized protein n=1 Tax=Paenibacillus roseus TaxID=2798579 RepID=A0A934MR44_9BACL|nr:hypothetical protein [Paenibacillus roseus]MBJ6362528.1 hypothetical protein [Paenibacillus roseus]
MKKFSGDRDSDERGGESRFAFLANLAVYIEHSDGTKELKRGKVLNDY